MRGTQESRAATRERVAWEVVACGETDESYTKERLERMCCSGAYTKRILVCQICRGDHEMVERRLRCSSVTCVALAVPSGSNKRQCHLFWKFWQCSRTRAWRIMATLVEHYRGSAECRGTHRAIITPATRKYIGDMDETGLAARHIWSGLRRYSAAPTINGIPSYKQVARYVKQLRAKHGERNSVDSIKTLGREFPLFSGIDADQGFTFGSTVDDQGFPRVGKGEGHDSLVLGVTTLGLLEKAKTIQQSNMYTLFHIDATFKQSETGYPVIICGFSDRARKYRLAAMFVVSRMTHIEYAAVLSALLQVYQTLFSIHPKINAVLGDAEDAQCNALQSTAQFQDAKFLMCFIHVLYNVRKRTRQLADVHVAMVYKGIIAMHYSANLLEYYHIRDPILAQWRMIPQLKLFADYSEKQWINGRFWRWQAFHTPTGFATTNNPCETLSVSVKRHVMRKMFDTERLLRKITRICEDVTADNLKPTVSCGGPPSTLVNMARKRVHSTLIVLFETHDPQVVRILQLKTSTESQDD